ncbi:hypothetical protein BD626DRAFT_540236 [Schizophyllum amplum]|uniref:Uncharacterized protein n=1 Tax=Schizophyllum amplum TaxID=97359 RepID=A0A550BZN7_9AGAR|nr:hypothetical protein BD626DRAFT_540236 [Auriculariopsis ampla]
MATNRARPEFVFFRSLDIVTVVKCRQLSRTFKGLVDLFLATEYHPSKALARYFPPGLYYLFRVVQHRSGAIVSGSTVVKLLARESFPTADLDIYANINCDLSILLNFLTRTIRYTYTARNTQHADLSCELDIRRRQHENNMHTSEYSVYGPITVLDFYGDTGQKIQLVLCPEEPRTCVLKFHCTASMNYITHDHIVCLYPRATLLDRVNVATNGPYIADHLLAKYAGRGWQLLNTGDHNQSQPRFTNGELKSMSERHLQDHLSFAIRIGGNVSAGALGIAADGVNSIALWRQYLDDYGTVTLDHM